MLNQAVQEALKNASFTGNPARCKFKVFVTNVDAVSYEFAHGFLHCIRPSVLLWQRQPCTWPGSVKGNQRSLFAILSDNPHLRELDLHCARDLHSAEFATYLRNRDGLRIGLMGAVLDGEQVWELHHLPPDLRKAAADGSHTFYFDNGSCLPTGICVTVVQNFRLEFRQWYGMHCGKHILYDANIQEELQASGFFQVIPAIAERCPMTKMCTRSVRCFRCITNTDDTQPRPMAEPSSKTAASMVSGGLVCLSNDLQKLFANEHTADVTVKVNEESVPAHSLILSARSTVFAATLASPMREAEDRVVTIDDIEAKTVRLLIYFIYSGQVDDELLKSNPDTIELLLAAHRYDIPSLVDVCTQSLSARVAVESVAEFLYVADLIENTYFKHQCMEFIRFHIAEVQATKAYSKFIAPRHALLSQILASLHPPIGPMHEDCE